MSNDFESMSVEELQAFRLEAAAEMDAAKQLFISAGRVLDVKLAQTPEAKALKKLHEARAELAAIAAEEAEAGGN